MGKSRFSSDEQKMVGTVSNRLKAMTEKERLKRSIKKCSFLLILKEK